MRLRRRRRALAVHTDGHTKLVALWCLRALLHTSYYRKWARASEGDARPEQGLLEAIGFEVPWDVPRDPEELERELRKRIDAAKTTLADQELPLLRNIELLGDRLHLPRVERDLLGLAVALGHEVHSGWAEPALQSCFRLLAGDNPARQLPIVAIMLDADTREVRHALRRNAPLAASGLVRSTNESDEPIRAMEALLYTLLRDHEDPRDLLDSFFSPVGPSPLTRSDFAHLANDVDLLVPLLQRVLADRTPGVNVLLFGRAGTGKTELARVLAAEAGGSLYAVKVTDEEGEGIMRTERFGAYLLCQNLLQANPRAIVLFDEAEDVFPSRSTIFFGPVKESGHNKGWTNRQLEHNPVPAIWITNTVGGIDPAFLRRFDHVVELRTPPRAVRRRMLERYLATLPVSDAWKDRHAADDRLTPADIERAARVASLVVPADPLPPERAEHPDPQALTRTVERTLDRTLETHLDIRSGPRTTSRRIHPTRFDLRYLNTPQDLDAVIEGLARTRRGTLCLHGPPGTGKTAFAQHLADRLEANLLLHRASDLLDCWLGGTERNIAQMFRDARDDDSILLLDEADSFLRDRRDAIRRWEVTQVNELLVQMEEFEGIFVCSTNLMESFDRASLRRFDMKIPFDYLRPDQRRSLFADVLEQLGTATEDRDPLDPAAETALDRLDRLDNLTPGDFATVVRKARILGKPPSDTELANAVEQECREKGEGGGRAIGFWRGGTTATGS